jgi:hypothetical protein
MRPADGSAGARAHGKADDEANDEHSSQRQMFSQASIAAAALHGSHQSGQRLHTLEQQQ